MRLFEITCPIGREPRLDDIRTAAADALHLHRSAVINVVDPTKSYQPTMVNADAHCHIVRRSIDARGDVKMRYQVEAYHRSEPYEEYTLPPYSDVSSSEPVIVVGAGPAGLFAALKLLSLGLRPVILERGKDVQKRKRDIAKLSVSGVVNPDSNYCFGEGGAGTFSDGKLFTRSSKRGDIREVLHHFVEFGADPAILIDAHPHIGTDKLPKVVENMRKCIISYGGEYHFDTKVTDVEKSEDGSLTVTAVSEGKTLSFSARSVILATGHSARDIYGLFRDKGWDLEAKGFAMGVRVEHPQALINKVRYHGQWLPGMPAAEYQFVEQVTENGPAEEGEEDARGAFSFCMCPGGILVPSTTEEGTIVLNGMSNSARNSKWANAGVVVSIGPEDVPEEYKEKGAFALLEFQRDIEKRMFDYTASANAGNPDANPQAAPAQRMIDFCNGVMSADLPETSYHPGAVSAPLHELLPGVIANRLRHAFPLVNKKSIRGYFTNDALLLGVESRTSSPVRIVRDSERMDCLQVPGLFPSGEGAGYSGGIVSSALDGINCAAAVSRYLTSL